MFQFSDIGHCGGFAFEHGLWALYLPTNGLLQNSFRNSCKRTTSILAWLLQLGAFCPKAIVYYYLKFKFRYLKNLKLFSITVKKLFERIDLRKIKGDGFLLFLNMLKAFA